MQKIKLNNGIEMPILGYGVFQIPENETEKNVLDAIDVGYRLIDTAQAYYNEEAVGRAIKNSKIDRKDFFLVTKIWISNSGEKKALLSIDESLKKLQTDYIDLILIHQPFGDYYGTYRAMETAYKSGKVRAIGLSNFFPDRFVDLSINCEIKPMVNQMETHIFNQQKDYKKILKETSTNIMAWAPLAEGKNGLFTNEILTQIGEKYSKTSAQVALRFLTQENVIVIPKTTHKSRMIENFSIFDFELSKDDIEKIKTLDNNKSLFCDHRDPEFVKNIISYKK